MVTGDPTPGAQRANARALEAHGRGDYEASLADFTEALQLDPTFRKARFNRACALTRLGRTDEAMNELGRLFCEDLPSYAPLAREDADLEALRTNGAIEAAIAEYEPRYLDDARTGTPLVAYGETAQGGFAQGGAWIHAARRFVPLTPRLAESDHGQWGSQGWAVVAPLADIAQRRAVVLTQRDNDSEGGGPERSRVRLFEVPSGRLIGDAHAPIDTVYWQAAIVGDAAMLIDSDRHHVRLSASGTQRTRDPYPAVFVTPRGPVRGHPSYEVRRGELVTPAGQIALPREHRRLDSAVYVHEASGIVVVGSHVSGDCNEPDRYWVDRVDLATRTVEHLFDGRGQIALDMGNDGALYVQRPEGTTRYDGARATAGEALPPGFGLALSPYDFNPYC